ncbi:RING-H2 finger protein [Quillaja saponaria]|uniref:RING-H2 finger protein n=1 Tax=Quillaja saponaria TaxID=32244 RepID=A0AAD7LQE9_QUISA|nr:RING-H2 finger protein [Quillaja saponaria]
MLGSGTNLITTIVGFGMSATFIVFVCTRIICGRLRGVRSRPMFEIESRIDIEQPEHHVSGLEPVLVAAIPTLKFNHEAFSSIEDAQCVICLSEYQEKEVLRIMPKCGHNFHLTCIDIWLRKQSTCPVCRLPLEKSLESRHVIRPVTFSIDQSFDDSETSIDHSRQWLLPGHEPSVGVGSHEGHVESLPRNSLEPTNEVEETRQ